MAHTRSLGTNTTSPFPSFLLQPPFSTLFSSSLLFQKHQQNLTASPLSAQPSRSPLLPDLPSLITTIACISISLILLFHRRSRRIRASYPPGPAPWPILGNIPSLGTLPHRSLANLTDRFGPIFTVWFGPTPCVVISSPDLARAALKAQDRLFSGRPLVTSTRVLTLGGKDIAFAPPDQAWKKRRRLAFLHLLSARQLAASAAQREEEVQAVVDAIAGEVRRCQHPAAMSGGGGEGGCVVNMRSYLGRATFNNILNLTVGKRYPYSFSSGGGGGGGGGSGREHGTDYTGKPGSAAAASVIRSSAGEASAGATAGNSMSSLEQEGERVAAMVDEVFLLVGAFNFSDHLPWLRWLDPQGIDARLRRVQPVVHGFARACIRERAEALKRMAKHGQECTGEAAGVAGGAGGLVEGVERHKVDGCGVQQQQQRMEGDVQQQQQRPASGGDEGVQAQEGLNAQDAPGGGKESSQSGGHQEQSVKACSHKVFVDFLLERQQACSAGGVGGGGGAGAVGGGVGAGGGEDSLEEEEMVMLVMDMILAGTDTTAKTVEWALAELVNHPYALKRLQDEVDAAYSAAAAAPVAAESDVDSNNQPKQPNLSSLPFLQAVIKETLRHHPVAPLLVPHKTTESTVLGGHSIPAGTMVLVNSWAICHDSRYWDRPQEFDPWRFMPTRSVPVPPSGASSPNPMAPRPQPTAEQETAAHETVVRETAMQATAATAPPSSTTLTPASWDPASAFLMLPFGGGRRGCAGMALGVDMAARMLAALLLRFHMAVAPDSGTTTDAAGAMEGRGGGCVELGEVLGLTMAMEKPLRLLLWEREAYRQV
ncbi:unnamed protein product [Closterium sp. Yama58-4]|nr:unnamed protein product [Closterium sp. Yama58-4]